MAGIISLINQIWLNLVLVIITTFLIYFPKLINAKKGITFPNRIEISILFLIYISIVFEKTNIINSTTLLTRIIFHLVISLIISLVGFLLIYILNNENKTTLNLSPVFMSFFVFCFLITIGVIWQVFRFSINYIFKISIQNYNPSDALGFLAIHSAGAIIISIFGFIYLQNKEDKYYIKKILRNLLGINKFSEKISKNEIKKIIKKGESKTLEFKSTLRTNLFTNEHDKKIEYSILKTITAFLNSKGGTLLIGIKDNGEILGIEKDNFKNKDKCILHLINLIKKHIGSQFNVYINSEILTIDNKNILKIDCKKTKKEVFLRTNEKEEFYIRAGPSSVQIEGRNLLEYVNRKFKN